MEMGWKECQSVSASQPDELDVTSSCDVVYVRKNINSTPFTDNDGNVVEGLYIWNYQEQMIDKKDWGFYSTVLENQRLDADQDQMILNHDFELLCIKEQILDIV